MSATDLFNPAAMFIIFREVLESGVILAVVLQFLEKVNLRKQYQGQVLWGVLAGSGISVVIGAGIVGAFYATANTLFANGNGAVFEGTICLFASLMLTVLAGMMLRSMDMQKKWERKLKQKLQEALTGNRKYAIFFLAFSVVLREGAECVMFMAGLGATSGAKALPIPGVVGFFLGLICAYVLFFSGRAFNLKWFFIASTTFLIAIAAGLMGRFVYEIQLTNSFGVYTPREDASWNNRVMWDFSACCSANDNGFFSVMSKIFYYNDQPTFNELFAYFSYLGLVFVWLWLRRVYNLEKAKRDSELLEMQGEPLADGEAADEEKPLMTAAGDAEAAEPSEAKDVEIQVHTSQPLPPPITKLDAAKEQMAIAAARRLAPMLPPAEEGEATDVARMA